MEEKLSEEEYEKLRTLALGETTLGDGKCLICFGTGKNKSVVQIEQDSFTTNGRYCSLCSGSGEYDKAIVNLHHLIQRFELHDLSSMRVLLEYLQIEPRLYLEFQMVILKRAEKFSVGNIQAGIPKWTP